MPDTPDLLHFTPVPLQRRARGWTPDAQAAFIAALAQCGIVAHAARCVGCSPRSAYHLRARPGADSFAAAWDWAIEMGLDAARDRAMTLIHDDAPRPLYRGKREVGYRTGPDHRIMFAALRSLAGDVEGLRARLPHRQRIDQRDRAEQAPAAERPHDPTPASAPPQMTPPPPAPPPAQSRPGPRARLL